MEWLTRRALQCPRTALLGVAILSMLAVAGLPRIETEVGYRGILGDAHPSVRKLEAFIEGFGGGLPVFAVFSCEETDLCETVFDDSALRMAKAVEEGISAHPLVRRVDSPASSPVLLPGPEGFEVRRFVEDGRIAPDRDALRSRAQGDTLWEGTLVSRDARVGAIVLQLASSDSRTTSTVVPELQAILSPFEDQGFRFHLVGDPVDFAVAGGELQRETPRIVPLMVALIAVIVFGLFRSWRVTLLALSTTGLAVLWAIGSMGWLGWPQSELTQALAPAILVIGICTTIHVLARYASRARGIDDTPEARRGLIAEVAREVGPACFIAALTTSAGFLSFSTSGFASFLRFGVIAALGVMAALVLTFTFLPILLARIRPEGLPSDQLSGAWDRALLVVLGVAQRRGAFVLTASGILLFVCGVGVSRLEVDVDERELLGSNSKVVHWAEFVEENLRRSDTLEIELTLPEGESSLEPEAMAVLEEVAGFLPTVEGLGRVRSVLDPLHRLNQVLHDDDPAHYRSGESRSANRQLLFVLRLDDATHPDQWIGPEERRVRLSVEADPLSKHQRLEILETVTSHLKANLPGSWRFDFTGPFALYLDLVREMQRTQLRSFVTAAGVITLLFWLFLWVTGSPLLTALRWALVGMIPSGLPVVVTLGAMGLWGIHLDVGTIMVGAIVLGIAVDDTIHLITHYLTERRAGALPEEALAITVRRVGRAVITTSIALALGFFALTISSWQSIASFGLLSGIAILAALAADLFVLPSLILGLTPKPSQPDPPEVSHRLPPGGRYLLGILVLLITAGTLHAAATGVFGTDGPRLACRLLPSGHVAPLASLDPACPLQAFDRIELLEAGGVQLRPYEKTALREAIPADATALRARVSREGRSFSTKVPLVSTTSSGALSRFTAAALLAVTLVGLGLFLLAYSSAPAAAPLLAVSVCLAVVAIDALCGTLADLPAWPPLVALGLAPAAAAHLALSFPRRGSLLAAIPGIVRPLYLAGVVNASILVWGAVEYPMLARAASAASVTLTTIIWAALLVKCIVARNESSIGFERARANVVLAGTAGVAASLGILHIGLPAEGAGRSMGMLTLALVGLPLPLGYALARYQLNDMRPHVRQVATYVFYQMVVAAALATLLAGVLPRYGHLLFSNPAPTLAALTLFLLLLGVARDGLWRLVRGGIPTVGGRLRQLEREHSARIQVLQEPDDTASITAGVLHVGLAASGVSLFLRSEVGWRLAASFGEGRSLGPDLAQRTDLAEATALLCAHSGETLHLALEEGAEGPVADRLREAGVELAVPLRSGDELLGMALALPARDGLPFTRQEISFAASLSTRAALAIHRAHLAEQLLQAERLEAVGQIATGLAHDLGKPISIVYQRARAMSRSPDLPESMLRQVESIAALADDALSTIDHLVEQGRQGALPSSGLRPAAEVIESAVQEAERLHGADRVAVRLTPGLPRVHGARDLQTVLVNLLDNALRASPEQPVEVYAVSDPDQLEIDVIDHGCGMDAGTLGRAFTPFFTTRSRQGGRGIGLASSRAVVEQLGGSIELASRPGEGTQAKIRLSSDGRREAG